MGADNIVSVSFRETADEAGEPFDAPLRDAARRANPFREGAVESEDDDLDALIVNIDGFEGPLHVLLALARTQKVDLRKLSVLQLVEQYLAFMEAAKARRLELAADYLVMAAWLAYLKSRLLIPQPKDEDGEPTGDEMAALLAFQLQRLEAMRGAVEKLMALPQFGLDVFGRGSPEGVTVRRKTEWSADFYDLLRAYADQRVRAIDSIYRPDPPKIYAIEEARRRLERILGVIPDWSDLFSLTETSTDDVDAPRASVLASAFNAALEFAKNGRLEIRQATHFAPIYVRRAPDAPAGASVQESSVS